MVIGPPAALLEPEGLRLVALRRDRRGLGDDAGPVRHNDAKLGEPALPDRRKEGGVDITAGVTGSGVHRDPPEISTGTVSLNAAVSERILNHSPPAGRIEPEGVIRWTQQ